MARRPQGESFVWDFLYTFFGNFISMALGMLSVLIFPKVMDSAAYGEYQLYLLYAGYSILLTLGIPYGIYLELGGKRRAGLEPSEIGHLFLVTLAIGVTSMVLVGFAGAFFRFWPDALFAVFVCLTIPLEGVSFYLQFVLQTTGYVQPAALAALIGRIISMAPAMALALSGFGLKAVLLWDIFGRVVSFGVSFAMCRKRGLISFDSGYARDRISIWRLMASGAQIMLSSYTGTIITGISRVAVQMAWGVAAFSGASLAVSVSNMFSRFANAVATPLFPRLRILADDESRGLYRTSSLLMSVLFYLLALVAPVVAWVLGLWLPAYAASLMYVSLLMPMCLTESKSTILVTNYCKSNRYETALFAVNAVSILASSAFCALGVCLTWEPDILLASMVFALALRLLLLELLLSRRLSLPDLRTVACDVVMMALMAAVYFVPWIGLAAYIVAFLLFTLIRRRELADLCGGVLSRLKGRR